MDQARPRVVSPTPDAVECRAYERGSELLGFDTTPQGYELARVVEAVDGDVPLYDSVTALIPRRSSKTTSVWAILLGRGALVRDFRAIYTAQDGTRAGQQFRSFMRLLQQQGHEDSGLVKLSWSNGRETIEFPETNARIWVVAPRSGNYRGEAADLLVFDEAGELDLDKSADILEGVLPLMDTRPMGQVIFAGTPATQRAGLFWDRLVEAREDPALYGIVDYSIDDATDPWSEDGELRQDVLLATHPGLTSGLTTLTKMLKRAKQMERASFEREYLCRFPYSSDTRAISAEDWEALERVRVAERPSRFTLAFDCAPDGSSAALVAAWRDEDGNPHVEVVEHRAGTKWIAKTVAEMSRAAAAVVYDGIGANALPAEQIAQRRDGTKGTGLKYADVLAAVALLNTEITAHRLRTPEDPAMDAAAEAAVWRSTERGRMFGRSTALGDVTPLVAAALALLAFDRLPKGGTYRPSPRLL